MYKYFLLALLLCFISCKTTTKNNSTTPNIVIILMDDLGYGDIANFGALNYSTPHIDKLANNGMLFTHYYAAQAVCSASRAGLLTGVYPNRIGLNHALMPNAKTGLDANEKTIAETVKEKGYATAVFGKWHLGAHKQFLPTQHGFDTYVGLPYSNDMWPVGYDGKPLTDTTNWRMRDFPVLPLIKDTTKIKEIRTLEDQATLTTLYTEKAVEFINTKKDKPFFLYLPHSMPHVPIAVSDKFKGKSKQGLYGDMMMEIDWSVGEIVKSLKENNILNNTLILFTSDNGPWLNFGNHAGSTGGLREGKGTSFEGGQRVPAIMMWPDVIPPGKINNELITALDLHPTIAEIVGGELPEHGVDGISMLNMIQGTSSSPRDHFYYYYGSNQLEAVRKDNWKLVLPHPSRSYENVLPGNDGYPGKTRTIQAEYALYNLRRDPGETYDVKALYPEKVAEIEVLVEKARKDMGDKLTNRTGSNTRAPGRLK